VHHFAIRNRSYNVLTTRKPPPAAPVSRHSVQIFPLLQRKPACACGCPRCKNKFAIQAKLAVSEPDDAYEKEADRVAEQVMQKKSAPCSCGGTCAECAQGVVQRSDDSPASSSAATLPDSFTESLGPGQPLDPATRNFMESRFGYDFSRVRVHSDDRAAESARSVNALAYTVGQDVVFGAGRYAREAIESHRLLAHELTHVIQQSVGSAAMVQRQLEIPVFDEFDPCIIVEGRKVCGSDAKAACEKVPSLPGCGTVCKIFGCKKPQKPSAKCPPGFRPGGSSTFEGQCCKEGTVAENERDCCPPERIGFKDNRCCGEGEGVSDGKCVKISDLPPPPSTFCLPSQKTTSGQCCTLPLIPEGDQCVLPKPPPPPSTPPALTIKETEIFFRLDRPRSGETKAGFLNATATAEGLKNFKTLVAELQADPALRVQLIGKASPDGPEDYNLTLGARRAELVKAALLDAGISESQLVDPAADGPDPACEKLGPGVANCGELGATGSRDRQVRARVFR
jgi:hypothetical protein